MLFPCRSLPNFIPIQINTTHSSTRFTLSNEHLNHITPPSTLGGESPVLRSSRSAPCLQNLSASQVAFLDSYKLKEVISKLHDHIYKSFINAETGFKTFINIFERFSKVAPHSNLVSTLKPQDSLLRKRNIRQCVVYFMRDGIHVKNFSLPFLDKEVLRNCKIYDKFKNEGADPFDLNNQIYNYNDVAEEITNIVLDIFSWCEKSSKFEEETKILFQKHMSFLYEKLKALSSTPTQKQGKAPWWHNLFLPFTLCFTIICAMCRKIF